MKEEKPSYYAIIPANVRYDNNLRANEKLLYWEITCLTQKTWECFATNSYFAKLYWVTEKAVSGWINNLKKYWYISVKIETKKEQKFYKARTIILGGVEQKFQEGIEQKVSYNNTSDNNINIITADSVKKKKKLSLIEAEEILEIYIKSVKKVGAYNVAYHKKALAIERIVKTNLDKQVLLSVVSSYIKQNREQIKSGYAKMAQYFFWPVERGSRVMYYQDYIEDSSKEQKKPVSIDDLAWN